MSLDRGEFRTKKISRLFLIALVGVFLLTGCTGKAITFEEAKAQAQEIKTYWEKDDVKFPGKVSSTTTLSLSDEDETYISEVIEKFDLEAKYAYIKTSITINSDSAYSEEWLYYEKSEDKTYAFAVGADGNKYYYFAPGEHFSAEPSIFNYYRDMDGFTDIFNEQHVDGIYKSKGAGSLYAKFQINEGNSVLSAELDIQNYLISLVSSKKVGDGEEFSSLIKATYSSFTKSKPDKSEFTYINI